MEAPFEVSVGDKIRVTPKDVLGTPDLIQISYETLCEDLETGDAIFINDGTVKLEVEGKDVAKNELLCDVKTAGKISNNKGCNMPSGKLSVNVVTEKDAADLEYIAKHLNPEFVAASFVGSGEVRALLLWCIYLLFSAFTTQTLHFFCRTFGRFGPS